MMKRLVFGILAHVDAGKTTLSEALLYTAGSIRRAGRVDHKDAFLDTFALERQRGITIFSKQAMLEGEGFSIALLDTPGHVDFSSEMERTLDVLDYAVLVISGTEGIQAHTQTLWELLRRRRIPVFLFVNKMDLAGASVQPILEGLQKRFGPGFVNFSAPEEQIWEEASLCDEPLLKTYLEEGRLSPQQLARPIRRRSLFPCFFGCALRLEGVAPLLDAMKELTQMPDYPKDFGAKVFKIARDEKGERLTYLKVTGGVLQVRDTLSGEKPQPWEEKANQLRVYSGSRFQPVQSAGAGAVCAVTGLTLTYPGMGLGCEASSASPQLQPVLSYRLIYPAGCGAHTMLGFMRLLQEEDPLLKVEWNEALQEIHLRLMGQVHLEILRQTIHDRFGVSVDFEEGGIVYQETVTEPVEGIGHYEPLRHYAEVRLLLEPGEPGSGLVFDSVCSTDDLDLNWQRLILTHLAEREHPGVLTGAPLTDVKITLLAGKGHLKHTEGGDFRQATYRAVRQGLKRGRCRLLEPWYRFRIEVPQENIGRVIADIQHKSGSFQLEEGAGSMAVLTGTVPVAEMKDYPQELVSFSKGRGRISLQVTGYAPCHDEEAVIERIGYDSSRDLENPCDSIFCSHGAGHVVPWHKVPQEAHTESPFKKNASPSQAQPSASAFSRSRPLIPFSLEEEKILAEIFARTYGAPAKRDAFAPVKKESPPKPAGPERSAVPPGPPQAEYLLVDGYNIIFSWDELKELAGRDLDAARQTLTDILINYHGYKGVAVILVFDAYKVKGGVEKVEEASGIHVVYTKEKETADMYIERTTYDMAKKHRVRVASSDNLEQMIILGHNAVSVSADAFKLEVEEVNRRIRQILDRQKGRTGGGQRLQIPLPPEKET
ncbi:MAG: GTP-binding protein [Oscillospiraceae bacterium]|nr:GTP-binding protein [Oscillospiraceae bacterium]